MIFRRGFVFLVLFSAVVVAAACASSSPEDWKFLGQAKAMKGADRDTIKVGAREGHFSKIQLRVKEHGVEIRDLKVHYENGGVEDIEIRKFIPAGGETRVIDLRGSDRAIEKVVFWYKTPRRARGQATVRLFGRH